MNQSPDQKLKPVPFWTAAKKAELLNLLDSNEVTVAEVHLFYPDLSAEELARWQELYAKHGSDGLLTTFKPST